MRAQAQLVALLVTLVGTVDRDGRVSFVPPPARGAERDTDRDRATAELASDPRDDEPGRAAVLPPAPASADMPPQIPPAGPAQEVISSARTTGIGSWGKLYLPAMAIDGGAIDLIVHFHGGSSIIEPLLERSGVHAVLLSVNLGIGSRAYADHFGDEHALDRMIAEVEHGARSLGVHARVRRIALMSWSAGYGAVQSLLRFPKNRDRIDAVLVADGIHGGWADGRKLRVHDAVMEPFMGFAQQALDEHKLMIVTHSEVETYGYCSTTESARYIVEAARLEPSSDPLPDIGMTPLSRHHRGGLTVLGYGGGDKAAHIAHVRHLDATMLAPLAQRWSR
jgi:hypothetical protein